MSGENSEEFISEIGSSLTEELQHLQTLSDECSIYRVPLRLRDVDGGKVYTPRVVSIGPLHHGRKELQAMEEHKKRYLKYFLESSMFSLQELLELIKYKETQLRNSYAETIPMSSKEFVKMVLKDSAFIIVVFLKNVLNIPELAYDRIFTKPKMIYEVRNDLILLENQLPFFILEDLFKLSKLGECIRHAYRFSDTLSDFSEGVELIKLTHFFFKFLIAIPENVEKNYSTKVQHLNHHLRICYIPPGKHMERKKTQSLNIPSAFELHQAGVEFKPSSSTTNLFDIKFRDGILEIPPLEIVDSSEVLFHNLCAFEQCHCVPSRRFIDTNHIDSKNEECHCQYELFSDYIAFMFRLVKGPKDAELLIQQGIISNRAFDNQQLSNFFHKLDKGLMVDNLYCYSDLIEELNKHSSATLNKWKATLKQGYFKTPWTTISVFAAAFLLLLTIVQTICTILQTKLK